MPKGCRMLHKPKNRAETCSCPNNCPDCTCRPEI
jgi:hypothetical protein